MKTVYIETSIVSYLTARPSNNLMAAAWQKVTLDWWDTQKNRFSLFTSDLVLEEAKRGNHEAASRRLDVLSEIAILEITDEVVTFSKELIKEGALPAKALDDALHVAVSTIHKVDYLLTWNCRHIDNAETKPIIREVCFNAGYPCPEICTPQELMGVFKDV